MGVEERVGRLKWVAAGTTAVLLAGFLTVQTALLWAEPIAQGSVSASLGLSGECPGFTPTDETPICRGVAFSPGGFVGTGFSVRNTGPVPLTVVSVRGSGIESEHMLAEMHAVLPPDGELFSTDEMRPFEPVVIGPGEEATIQMVGQVRSCEAVQGYYTPGSALGTTSVRLKVRWLLASKDVDLPLQQAVFVYAPTDVGCVAG